MIHKFHTIDIHQFLRLTFFLIFMSVERMYSPVADRLTRCGLDTEPVDVINLFVWEKMVMKCTMASIYAVTGKAIKKALKYPPTGEIADACFNEVLAVAKSMGYDLGEDYR